MIGWCLVLAFIGLMSDEVAGQVKSWKVKGAKVGTKPLGGRRGRLQLSRPRVAPYGLR